MGSDDWSSISAPNDLKERVNENKATGQAPWGYLAEAVEHYENCERGDR